MSDKLQQIFSKLTQTGEQITYTTNEQILDCIAETAKAFEGAHPDKTEDIKTYFSLWKELFEKLNYDDVSADLKKVHQYSIQYPSLPCSLYSIFNKEAILDDTDSVTKTSLSESELKDSLTFSSEYKSNEPMDINNPIIVCEALSAPIVIDGNEKIQNPDTPLYLIPYMKLTKQHFINEFNFAVFTFAEEVNACFNTFDAAVLMQSYLRIGNKFKL